MSRPRAWVLNLDADDELASPSTYVDPFAALAARPHLKKALAALVQSDVVLGRGERAPFGAVGRTFSPTPAALRALAAAGAERPPAPDSTVLRRVADRRFGLALGGGHVPDALVLEGGRLDQVVDAIPGPRVFKRIFGFAGRGRLLTRGGSATDAEQAFVDRALRADGAVVVEPWLERTLDLAIHGFVRRDDVAKSDLVMSKSDVTGDVTCVAKDDTLMPKSDPVMSRSADSAEKMDLAPAPGPPPTVAGCPTIQVTHAAGGWRSTRLAEPCELSAEELRALGEQVRLVGSALRASGYWGPFGVDAFRYLGPAGPALVARCEVNARFTMGWAIGMGACRPDLEHQLEP